MGLAVLLLAGCRVDARVEITMHGDGTGVVQASLMLDGAAVREIGGLDVAARQIRLHDMRTAGWKVSDWKRGTGGSATITFTHPYQDARELSYRIADLVGTKGILRDPKLERERGWFSSHDAMSIVIDLRAPSTGIGSDADLRFRLTQAGVDPAVLDSQFTKQLRDALHVSVAVHMPGGSTREYNGTTGAISTFRASQARTNYDQMVKVGIAATLALLAGLFLLAAAASARRDRRRQAQRLGSTHVEQERAPLM